MPLSKIKKKDLICYREDKLKKNEIYFSFRNHSYEWSYHRLLL